jgi:hypothetical protein
MVKDGCGGWVVVWYPAPCPLKTLFMQQSIILPEFGNDWITGCEGLYIIISLKYSSAEITMYWRSNERGYSDSLVGAGFYTEDQVKLICQRPFLQALPIPCTRDAFLTLGLYPVVVDYNMLTHFEPIRV